MHFKAVQLGHTPGLPALSASFANVSGKLDKSRKHLANTNLFYRSEREGRERVREELGDDADEGHDERIEKLEDTELVVRNRIACCKGEYSYHDDERGSEAERDGEERGDNEDELEDMDIESDSH